MGRTEILRGFSEESQKLAVPALVAGIPAAAALAAGAAGYGAYKLRQRERLKRKALKKKYTGTLQPGAGMIVPPHMY
jgi:hypothetical protein